MNTLTSKQVNPPNPTGKGGFIDHPENRGDGRWDKNNSFSFWMNYFKSITVEEFKNYETKKTDKERTVAESIAYARVVGARKDINEFKEVANRTEGMPKQSTDLTSGGEKIKSFYDLLIASNKEPDTENKQ